MEQAPQNPRNATRDPRDLRNNSTRDGNQHETGSLASRMNVSL